MCDLLGYVRLLLLLLLGYVRTAACPCIGRAVSTSSSSSQT
jgi:hypothetical protein